MASMVAKACSSTSSQMPAISVREKGSRNKRKFRAEPPSADASKAIPLPPNECTSFEFSAEKFGSHRHGSSCDMCCVNHDALDTLKLDLGLSCTVGTASEVGLSRSRELAEASVDEFHDADWSDLTESELEDLVLRNLDTIFTSATKKIVACGYSEEVATRAILRFGAWYGCKDTISNIADNTLAFLRSGQEMDPLIEHHFEDLQQMEKYVLAELVCLLREVRPLFSTGDAMWCLMICDMNVSHACAMDGDPSGTLLGNAASNVSPLISDLPQLRTEFKGSTSNVLIPYKAKASVAYSRNCLSRTPKLASIRNGHSYQSEAPKITNDPILKPSFVSNGLIPDHDSQNSSGSNAKAFSAMGIMRTAMADEKFVGSGKVSQITNREYILRQKSMHLEKHNRAYGSKGSSSAGKLSSFRGLVLDKKLKGVADSTGLSAKKSPFKINEAGGLDNFSSTNGSPLVPTFGLETLDQSSPLGKSGVSSTLPMAPGSTPPLLPVADTELSLSYSTENIANPMPISYSIESSSCGYHGSPNDKPLGQWAPHDKKDEMIMKMVPRVRELQNQLQGWMEWANQRVMQAARRLSKDKAELKTLRQEREEIEKLKKERQAFQENAMKKFSEMEHALRKTRGQMEQSNACAHRLEIEKASLRQEMEAAKLRAAESAASCKEVSKREKNTLMKFQSWEKQKTIFQEELVAEKSKLVQSQQKLQQAEEEREQVVANLNQEEKAKDELLTQCSSLRKEREQIEASTQSKEAIIKSRAEINLSNHKEDIKRLEKEISRLRLKTDSSKIAALRRGIDGSYVGKVTNSTDAPTLKDMSRTAFGVDFQDFTANGGVRRERECVMCLSEEMSVVFLPCAHQVVCTTCNELHEKQGMKECPSCRCPIQRRVCVLYACSS